MKKLNLLLTAILFAVSGAFAQAPQSFKYQAVARNSTGDILTNQNISIRISIHETSPGGTVIYEEEHVSVTTNEFGLVNLEIGTGFPISGTFSAIDWGSNDHFIEIEMDETGSTSYTFMGTAQLLSVPYALHAKTVETVTETDPVFGLSVASGVTGADTTNWNNKLDSYIETDPVFGSSVASGITGTDTTNWNNKLDSYTETDPVFGSSVANGITGADTTNWNNKLDSYIETDPVFGSSVASGITGTDTTNWNNKLDTEIDADITNELQTLSLSGDTLFLSNGNYILLGSLIKELSWSCGDDFTDDRDGKTYKTVKIGAQCWMAENLNYGTYVPVAAGGQAPAGTQKYCQNLSGVNDSACPFGGLYEWAEMMDGSATCNGTAPPPDANVKCSPPVQGVCPTGWHVPSHYEWTLLEKNVGTNPDAFPYDITTTGVLGTDEGGNLKQTGTANWTTPNTGATNSSGFTALPGGYSWSGSFGSVGYYGSWWSSTEYSATNAWFRTQYYDNAQVSRDSNGKLGGFSVRCVKD